MKPKAPQEHGSLNNQDIRAKILEDIYARELEGEEPLPHSSDYASLLRIDEAIANFNLDYLVKRGLVDAKTIGGIGELRKMPLVYGLTPFGIESVEGRSGRDLAINYQIINVNAPVSGQVAIGDQVSQTQSNSIDSFQEFFKYIDEKLDKSQTVLLRPLIEQLEAERKADSIRPSTLQKIRETAQTWGPVAVTISDFVRRLIGLG